MCELNSAKYKQALNFFANDVKGLTSHNVWQSIVDNEYLSEFGDTHDFEFKKKFFFDFIRYALENGYFKLGKNDCFLTGSIDEQLKLWKTAFPSHEKALLTDDGFFYIWFFLEECPAGFVWLFPQDDGSIYEHWT